MKVFKSDKRQVTGDEVSVSCARCSSCHSSLITLAAPKRSKGGRHSAAFTLIEMLVVIAILGILAGLAVPAITKLGKSNATVGASRQLLDDIARARQIAISQRTTVYMVFVPANFWYPAWRDASGNPTPAWNNLSTAQQAIVTNLCDNQLSGYALLARGTVGDQPGRHNWHYVSPWQNLPAGNFIASAKFGNPYTGSPYSGTPNQVVLAIDPNLNLNNPVYGFMTNAVPFPVATNNPASAPSPFFLNLPCLMFDSFGHLVDQSGNILTRHEYIPLAHGSIAPATDPATKAFVLANGISVEENPWGNSTNISANVIDIDPLTGRAVLQYYKMAP